MEEGVFLEANIDEGGLEAVLEVFDFAFENAADEAFLLGAFDGEFLELAVFEDGDAGFERETRAFHPHLTIGRVERENGAGAFRGLDEMLAEPPYAGSVQVKSVELMRSQTSRDGAQYTLLSSYPLGEG